jgi:Tol biopolymer transport system component
LVCAVVAFALTCGFACTGQAEAAFPGSPGLIAVQRSADPSASNIWLLDWQTGAARQLTHGDYEAEPAFSPNGRWIAFRSDASWHGYLNIWAIRTDGSGLHRLTKGKGAIAADEPAFSANGRWVAFSAEAPRHGGYEIERVALRGGPRRVLIPGTRRRSAWAPAYSPDGRHLVWVQGPEVGTRKSVPHIFIRNTHGRGTRRLTAGTAPQFSPDGRSIVFLRPFACANGLPGSEIDVLSLDPGQLTHVKESCGLLLRGPTFSPDGTWIAYTIESAEKSALGFAPLPGTMPSFAPLAGLGADLPVDESPSWQPIP